jgi:hypothetical protein
MAWLDDRFWCHPKVVGLTPLAYRAYVNGVTYCSGMGTQGRLDGAQQKLVGSSSKQRDELVTAGLWDMNGDGETVVIHDWDEHNGKRDERRRKDRERKRKERRNG